MWSDKEFACNCLEFFDFAVASAKVFKKLNPEKTFSEILKNHTMLPWSLRNSTAECRDYPAAALAFLEEADSDLDKAAEKFRPELEKLPRQTVPQHRSGILSSNRVCRCAGRDRIRIWNPISVSSTCGTALRQNHFSMKHVIWLKISWIFWMNLRQRTPLIRCRLSAG